MKVLVTGASGFVGRPLCAALTDAGHEVRAATRSTPLAGYETVYTGDMDGNTDWRDALRDVEAVVHLAARVHVMDEREADPLTAFARVNRDGTQALAAQAAQAGVKRFVLVSSIKVNGEATAEGEVWREDGPTAPEDPYGVSKLMAEQALRSIAADSGMEAVIVRPPLVYGPGVGANFARLMRLVDRGYPLPFKSVNNRRSMVYVGNLVDALVLCATHTAVAGRTYFVADEPPLSTAELVIGIARALGKTPRLFSVPASLLRLAGSLARQTGAIERLTGSLLIDGSRIRRDTGWTPRYSFDDGLRETAHWYRQHRDSNRSA